jgi:hypothetical protein
MNLPLAISPLVVHIPHAVPVVIVWAIMTRFYLAQRKLKREGGSPAAAAPQGERNASGPEPVMAADRPAPRKFRAVDDAARLSVRSTGRDAPVTVGPTPTAGLE